MLKRIPEVFECFFENGSMPYARCNYPYGTNEKNLAPSFTADFITEGIDYRAGWVHAMKIISVIVND